MHKFLSSARVASTNHPYRTFRRGIANLCLVAGLTLYASAFVLAAGDAQQGREKSLTCAACHGQDGNSINPEWPNLAGQHESYIAQSLQTFKDHSRENILMNSQVISLDEQAMQDLAAFFSAQTRVPRTADPALVEQGERLYRGGDLERGVSACTACHGPLGAGNPGAGYPSLAGQHATYTASQLLAYRSNTRQTDPNQMMRNIAALLTEDEIRAVAAYIQGLQ
jgi:cytochrome c553